MRIWKQFAKPMGLSILSVMVAVASVFFAVDYKKTGDIEISSKHLVMMAHTEIFIEDYHDNPHHFERHHRENLRNQ